MKRLRRFRQLGRLLWDSGLKWWDDKAPRLGAALAFYTTLSLSPILLIVVFLSGWIFGDDVARHQVVSQLRDLTGDEGASAVEMMMASAWSAASGPLAAAVAVGTLVVGATGVFAQLQDALNDVWGVEPKASVGLWGLLKDRLLSFAMICGLAFLLLVSLVFNAALSAVGGYVSGLIPSWSYVLQIVNALLSFFITFVLFAMIFKLLPEAKVAWSDVWIGAGITAVLFGVGKYLIGLYLGRGAVGSAYGAAGSFVVLLLWVYYSTQILLFGAEFTQLYADRYGWGIRTTSKVVPKDANSLACPTSPRHANADAAPPESVHTSA
jgi:membrane protein